jgi:hypothetical protein
VSARAGLLDGWFGPFRRRDVERDEHHCSNRATRVFFLTDRSIVGSRGCLKALWSSVQSLYLILAYAAYRATYSSSYLYATLIIAYRLSLIIEAVCAPTPTPVYAI